MVAHGTRQQLRQSHPLIKMGSFALLPHADSTRACQVWSRLGIRLACMRQDVRVPDYTFLGLELGLLCVTAGFGAGQDLGRARKPEYGALASFS